MTIKIDGFAVDREIGRGGFGIVYRATQLAFNRLVAIKVLHAGTPAADLQKRFLQECRAVGSLRSHPNILTVYSTGVTADGAPYLAMELLTGGSLSERLPMAPSAAAALGVRLADGLQIAHAAGVIHRDVKPSNVLFNAADEPVLVDFGISTIVGEATTTSRNVAVSIGYAPPEVLDGARPGVAADVYALGATLFACVTGRTPFVKEDGFSSLAVIAARIVSQPVEDLRPLGVPPALCEAIEKSMAKDPQERYASMADFRAALLPIADDATIRTPAELWGGGAFGAADSVAATVPPVEKTGRLRSRRRLAVAVGAVAGVAALGASIAVWASPGSTPKSTGGAGVSVGGSQSGVSSSPGSGSVTSSSSSKRKTSISPRVPGHVRSSITKTTTNAAGQTITITQAITPRNTPTTRTTTGRTTTAVSPPTVTSQSLTRDEGSSVDISLGTSSAKFTLGNSLPRGLSRSGSHIVGTIKANAVTTRTSYKTPTSGRFVIHVIGSNAGGSRTGTVTITVRDTELIMPNYIGLFGNGDHGTYDVGQLAARPPLVFDCYLGSGGADSTIKAQWPGAGATATWGTTAFHITYWRATSDPKNPCINE